MKPTEPIDLPPVAAVVGAGRWKMCVAPMLDWTDRHCRYFHRLLSRHARLYSEMVTTGALMHGDIARHLSYNETEHPVALQLGGCEPTELAHCAKLAVRWGYDEINLNCGCPSERVQRGAFGACLMAEPRLVAECVRAMIDVVSVPVTVKHRIGINQSESYDLVRDFVGTVSEAGCNTFIVHARNAWLRGLSPKENRNVPALRYDMVYRLKNDFPGQTIVINGGVISDAEVTHHLAHVDGVMVGREAYHNPWWLASWDETYFDAGHARLTREQVEEQVVDYMRRVFARDGTAWPAVARPMLGLRHGLAGARKWRQVWSDHRLIDSDPSKVLRLARSAPNFIDAGTLS